MIRIKLKSPDKIHPTQKYEKDGRVVSFEHNFFTGLSFILYINKNWI